MSEQRRIAAVLVTHNSEAFLPDTLRSIAKQTVPVDVTIAVDDQSTDQTAEILTDAGFIVLRSTSTSDDLLTRVAHNFVQGIRAASQRDAEIVILGDHDDIWHQNRIAHQRDLLVDHPNITMVASDGFLIDEHGAALPGTIRQTFPVPEEFETWTVAKQVAYGLRHSLATGGASAIRTETRSDWSTPPGWLHDRWWSLRALREGTLLIDRTAVIDYRLSPGQQIGLDDGFQDSKLRWLGKKVRDLASTGRKATQATELLKR